MRRVVFVILGVLEFAVAAVLVGLAFQLPSGAEVEESFGRAERVTEHSGAQVRLMRDQVHDLRRPEMKEMAANLETETHTVTTTLRDHQVDYDSVKTMSTSLGDVATGLEGMSETFDPEGVGKIGDGLGATASYLDGQVIPASEKAADRMEESTANLKKDSDALRLLLKEAPIDLKAAREVHDSLARFNEGLDTLNNLMKTERLETMRDGFRGLETSLTTGAGQVERLAGFSYPVVTFQGMRPVVEQRPFWPEGGKIAEGMRKAAAGADAAAKETDDLLKELPKMKAAVEESRKLVEKTREGLAVAIRNQDKLEPVLKNLPEHTAKLAEDLPKLSGDLAKILRDTQKLKELAASLRQTQKGIDTATAHWPELRTMLSRSATILKQTQKQLDQTLQNRRQYEAALRQTIVLAEAFSTMLPMFINQLDRQLAEQERALDDLGASIDEVQAALPVYAETTSRIATTARLLLWLMAGIAGLHGCYLTLGTWLGKRDTA